MLPGYAALLFQLSIAAVTSLELLVRRMSLAVCIARGRRGGPAAAGSAVFKLQVQLHGYMTVHVHLASDY